MRLNVDLQTDPAVCSLAKQLALATLHRLLPKLMMDKGRAQTRAALPFATGTECKAKWGYGMRF